MECSMEIRYISLHSFRPCIVLKKLYNNKPLKSYFDCQVFQGQYKYVIPLRLGLQLAGALSGSRKPQKPTQNVVTLSYARHTIVTKRKLRSNIKPAVNS